MLSQVHDEIEDKLNEQFESVPVYQDYSLIRNKDDFLFNLMVRLEYSGVNEFRHDSF